MSAPPLPEIFGNYSLGDFVEVVSPAGISWLPQTAGWLWLAAFALAYGLQRGWRWLRHWYRNRYRREATAALAGLAEEGTSIAQINRLLKLTALAVFPREQVASLSGDDWVNFLNKHCPAAPFSPQQGQWLALGSYCELQLDSAATTGLLQASASWVNLHESPLND